MVMGKGRRASDVFCTYDSDGSPETERACRHESQVEQASDEQSRCLEEVVNEKEKVSQACLKLE